MELFMVLCIPLCLNFVETPKIFWMHPVYKGNQNDNIENQGHVYILVRLSGFRQHVPS